MCACGRVSGQLQAIIFLCLGLSLRASTILASQAPLSHPASIYHACSLAIDCCAELKSIHFFKL